LRACPKDGTSPSPGGRGPGGGGTGHEANPSVKANPPDPPSLKGGTLGRFSGVAPAKPGESLFRVAHLPKHVPLLQDWRVIILDTAFE
jgi:hypothetical protein